MIQLVIVEDSLEAREGFRYLLSFDSDIQVLKVYESAERLLADAHILKQTDLILMDIELPGMSGIEATRVIKDQYPRIEILILTIFEDQEKILKALSAGASGYLLKNTDPGELAGQVKSVSTGGSPISPFAARKLLEDFQQKQRQGRDLQDYHLTKREVEVCKALLEGYTYREMADQMHMASSTAKKHILNIYRKLQVNSKVEFIRKVIDERLFDLG
jgi:DNA-binding NarL/FixJ family response regulator